MCKMKAPKAPTPQAPAPAPAPPAAAAEILDAESEKQDSLLERAARKGRKSLRIDQSSGPGLNIPGA